MPEERIKLDAEVLCHNCKKLTNTLFEIPAQTKSGSLSGKPCATFAFCCPHCRSVLGISRVFD
ncbi:MAG: hypothetical protein ACTSPM_03905 [Candidatus Heimdallarchaeota archaeon]